MAFKMKGSPYKNYRNPKDYKVFNMGNEASPAFKQKQDSELTRLQQLLKNTKDPIKKKGIQAKIDELVAGDETYGQSWQRD